MSILFEQVNPVSGEPLPVPLHKQEFFIECLNRGFSDMRGDFIFGKDEVQQLKGMAACWREIGNNPFELLVMAVHRYGKVRVWRMDTNEEIKHAEIHP